MFTVLKIVMIMLELLSYDMKIIVGLILHMLFDAIFVGIQIIYFIVILALITQIIAFDVFD
jgi:hypothetical protein